MVKCKGADDNMAQRNYREDGSRIWECDTCDCNTCVHKNNNSYDSEKCRFRYLLCSACKGRHCRTMCPDYEENPFLKK